MIGKKKEIEIDGTRIGNSYEPYVIAELSGNHNNSINNAQKLIMAAKEAGANAVKIQTFKASALALPSRRDEFVIKSGLWKGCSLHELYEKTSLPYEWHKGLFEYAAKKKITIFSSPFSEQDVEFLEELGCCAYKIASNELTHYPLIEEVIRTGKPIILSTGTATKSEIESTLELLDRYGAKEYILLYCVSAYPTPVDEMCLSNIKQYQETFNIPVGLSDHSLGTIASVVAVSLGACVIEKHFTLDRNDGGSDSPFSLEPNELMELTSSVRQAYKSVGNPVWGVKDIEKKSPVYRRRYYTTREIKKGEVITNSCIRAVRGPSGILSQEYEKLIGKYIAKKDIPIHNELCWPDLTEC